MNWRKLWLLCLIMVMGLVSVGCGNTGNQQATQGDQESVDLMISAAASLKDAMEELRLIYREQNPRVEITFNFAASGPLQRQIEEGAPVDLFISAGQSQMDALEEKDLIVADSRQDLLGNELVLIIKEEADWGFADLTGADVAKVSIGTPETVPAGKYAQEALINMELWDKLQPKLVLAKDVRQVLTYVETGNVDAGMVYRSDALVGQGIKIVAAAPEDSHKPIIYPMAVIEASKNKEAAQDFAGFLTGADAAQVLEKHGFKTDI